MKDNSKFSSSVGASLNGRSNAKTTSEAPTKRSAPPDPVKETKKEKPEKTPKEEVKKGNPGRPALSPSAKKKQLVLTVFPDVHDKLFNAGNITDKEVINADGSREVKPFSDYRQLLSKYIEKNIDAIVKELGKIK